MATTTSPATSSARHTVAPLRAGQGYSFFLRRLHSLSGIIPIGAFLLEHFISNAEATRGVAAYTKQVEFLTGLPFVVGLELFGIWLPILYHSLYGFYIWYRGQSNLGEYPWAGNWLYTAQRYTGAIAFFYMAWHTWHLRFSGVHLPSHPELAFAKVQAEFQSPWALAFYALGITAASWHFAYGLWLFCAKWGITTGARARQKFGYICLALGIGLVLLGGVTMYSFVNTPLQPLNPGAANMESSAVR